MGLGQDYEASRGCRSSTFLHLVFGLGDPWDLKTLPQALPEERCTSCAAHRESYDVRAEDEL